MAVLLSTVALAQGSSTITGNIINAADKKPVPNAVVTATSPSLQGEQTVVTDPSGFYRIPQLPSGTYTLRVEAEGFRPFRRGDVQLRVDRTIRVNVELLPESLQSEEIVVTAAPPTIDVGSNTAGINVDAKFLNTLAVIRPGSKGSAARSFESLAEMAPGALEDQYGVSVNGSTSPESQYVVDGLSVNDPSVGTVGTPLSVEFVKEVNIITGGYMPEYGRSTGGVLNVVTESGSNEFHGSVFANMAPGFLQTPGLEIQQAGSVISARGIPWNLGDFGAELGGPILKDKLWFYAGVAPSFTRIRVDRQLSTLDICTEVDPANGCTAVGRARVNPTTGFQVSTPIPGTQVSRFADDRTVQYIGKLTYLFDADHNLSVSVYGTPNASGGQGRYAFSRDGAPEVCTGLSCTGFVQGSYESIATRRQNSALDIVARQSSSFFNKTLLLDATVGWHHQDASTLPSDGSGILTGEGLSATPNISWRRARRITDFEQIPDPTVCNGPNGTNACPISIYSTGGPNTINVASLDRVQAKALGTYLFTWLGHHIVKAGIDAERSSYANNRARTGGSGWRECTGSSCSFFTTNQYGYLSGPDTPRFLPNKQGTSSSVTVGGFLQDSWSILDKVTLNAGLRYDVQTMWGLDNQVGLHLPNQWSPRVGVIYDFTQAGRSKLYANYARFFENVPLDMADLSFPQQRLITTTYRNPCDPSQPGDLAEGGDCTLDVNRVPPGGNPEGPNQLWYTEGGDRVPVDPLIKAQSSDELMVGGEYELFFGRLGAFFTWRYLNDVIEDMSRDDGSTFFIGNPGKGYSTDFPEARRDYRGLSLYYTRSLMDGWVAQASYTYSRLKGNYSGLFRADTGQLSPNLTRDFDLLSLTFNRDGLLPGDRTHSVKVFGGKEFKLGKNTALNLGLSYRGYSGTPLNYLGAHPRRSGSETFILPRGSGGRSDWVNNADARLGLDQRLPGGYTVSLSLDVFNVLNFQQATARDQTFTFTRVYPIERGGSVEGVEGCREAEGPCQVIATGTGTRISPSEVNPNFGRPVAYQAPRSIRLGAKLSF